MVCGKVKACISHVPGITFPPHSPNIQFTFPLLNTFPASVFALECTFPLQ
jgi:hypothetical protein